MLWEFISSRCDIDRVEPMHVRDLGMSDGHTRLIDRRRRDRERYGERIARGPLRGSPPPLRKLITCYWLLMRDDLL